MPVWKKTEFTISTRSPHANMTLQGYTYGRWGIDKGRYCWRLTHLPTGLHAIDVCARLRDTKRIVEYLEDLADIMTCDEKVLAKRAITAMMSLRREVGAGTWEEFAAWLEEREVK